MKAKNALTLNVKRPRTFFISHFYLSILYQIVNSIIDNFNWRNAYYIVQWTNYTPKHVIFYKLYAKYVNNLYSIHQKYSADLDYRPNSTGNSHSPSDLPNLPKTRLDTTFWQLWSQGQTNVEDCSRQHRFQWDRIYRRVERPPQK